MPLFCASVVTHFTLLCFAEGPVKVEHGMVVLNCFMSNSILGKVITWLLAFVLPVFFH